MNCELGSENETISSLKSLPAIKEVHLTLGMYDIIAKVEGNTEDEIKQTITGTIRKQPKIHSTMTLIRAEGEDLFKPSERPIEDMPGKNVARAYLVIHSDKGEEYSVLKELTHIPEVKEADVVFGYYDVICKIETSEYKTLENVITKAIRTLHM